MNKSLDLESACRPQMEEMESGSSRAETTSPDPLLVSRETQGEKTEEFKGPSLRRMGGRATLGSTGWLARLRWRDQRWLVVSLALNLILIIIIISIVPLIAQPAKKCEPCPAASACTGAACPDGWIGYLGKCYYFSVHKADWPSSQSNCSAHGASLAGIDTPQEMDFMKRYKDPYSYWIGLWRDPGKPWKWTNGTEFNHQFPILGEESCAFMNKNGVASSSCSRELRWICSNPVKKMEGKAK